MTRLIPENKLRPTLSVLSSSKDFFEAARTLSLERQPGLKPGALVWIMNFSGAPNSPRAFSLSDYIRVSQNPYNGTSLVV